MKLIKSIGVLCCAGLLSACGSKISSNFNQKDWETKYETNMAIAKKVAGYETAYFDIIGYKATNSEQQNYKIKIRSTEEPSPEFLPGESLTLVLDKFEHLKLPTDGEATSSYHNGKPIREVYYDINRDTLKKITKAKNVEFIARGKGYDVAGVLTKSELKTFAKLLNS